MTYPLNAGLTYHV